MGVAGQPVRPFELIRGPHWTAIAYRAAGEIAPTPVKGLHIHRIGNGGDLKDEAGHFVVAYSLKPGSWVLIRPDSYVGAIVEAGEAEALAGYSRQVGWARTCRRFPSPARIELLIDVRSTSY